MPPDSPIEEESVSTTPVVFTSRTIDLVGDFLPEHFFRELVGAYLSGGDEIVVTQRGGIQSATRAVVVAFVARIGGYPACEERRDRLVLWNLGDPSPTDLPKLTHRLGELALELLSRSGDNRHSGLSELDWDSLDDSVDRAAWEVHRAVERACRAGDLGNDSGMDVLGWLEAARALERIADHAVLIGVNGSRWRATRPSENQIALVSDFHGRAVEYVRSVLDVVARHQAAQANLLIDLGGALRETARTLVDRLIPTRDLVEARSPAAIVPLSWMLHSLERTVAYGQDLAEVVIDHAGTSVHRPIPLRAVIGPVSLP
jgi:phosphate uptake regulator